MKKFSKCLVSFIIIIMLIVSTFAFNVSAANVTVTGGNYEVGQEVKITVRYNGDKALEGVQLSVSYNSSVLEYKSVSGVKADGNSISVSNGTINFVDDVFNGTSKTGSYTIVFKAIKAGNSDITVSATGSDTISSEFVDGKTIKSSTAVTVNTPKPSSNANLASIKLSNGSLSPAFNANTTNYNVTVKYDVDEINVTGSVADGKSRVAGGGTVGLQVGNNECVLTVTAEDGTKKSYIINIKRMTEEETLAAEEDARNSNPLLVVIDGADYTIVNDLKDITIPTGFTQGTATRKESEITVLNDVGGKYQLCWLVDQNGENGAWYKRDESDNFKRLAYIVANDVMYIVESIDGGSALPSGFVRADFTLDGQTVDTIKYKNEALGDFCIFNCYVAGKTENEYYRYDTIEGTMQRATDFVAAESGAIVDQPADSQQTTSDEKSWFDSMTKTGKMVFFLIIFIALILVVIGVLVVVKIVSPKRDIDDEDEETEEDIE